jgi:hypothetical protein
VGGAEALTDIFDKVPFCWYLVYATCKNGTKQLFIEYWIGVVDRGN